MEYLIFFDESNKLDNIKKFSYYGAYGGDKGQIEESVKSVKEILRYEKKPSEFHFTEYKNDYFLAAHLKLLDFMINTDIHFNFFVVDNQEAYSIATKMGISIKELRKLFYVKIPERLFYGLTRGIEYSRVKILVDHSPEYGSLRLFSKLKLQMNSHSVYRGLNYQVTTVEPKISHASIPIQVIDMFMGIVVFLMEKSYLNITDDKPIIKSDLIYRFLIQNNNLEKFQNQIRMYQWNGLKDTIHEANIGNYLSEFMKFKTQFDIKEMIKLNEIMRENPTFRGKDLRLAMGYTNNQLRQLLGYKDELNGLGRNGFIFNK
jgi:hypothetical protein